VDAISSQVHGSNSVNVFFEVHAKSMFFFDFLFRLFAVDGARLWRQARAGGNRLVAVGFWRIWMWSLRGQVLAL
jgi:hypothetical protein